MPTDGRCDGVHLHALPTATDGRHLRLALRLVTALAVVGGVALLVPRLGEVGDALALIRHGAVGWIAVAVLGAVAMHVAYVALFRAVLGPDRDRIGVGASATIAFAGLAANRVVSAGGAGGVALTAWALRRRGLRPARIADLSVVTVVVTYAPYVAAVAACGLGLALSGVGPEALTLWPGAFATALLLAVGLLVVEGAGLEARRGRLARAGASLRRGALALDVRGAALPAALAFWGAQVLVLWAAFGVLGVQAPALAVLVLAFFLGMLGNLLPAPGGVGGVEGGMVAALVGLGVAAAPALAAVVLYRLVTNWLPLLPCLVASARLSRALRPGAPPAGRAAA